MKITGVWVMAQWPNEMKVNTLPEQLESLGKILCWQQQLCGKLQSCKIMCNNIYYLFLKRRFEDKKCALWKPQVVFIQTRCRHKWWFCRMKNWICNTAENWNTTSDGIEADVTFPCATKKIKRCLHACYEFVAASSIGNKQKRADSNHLPLFLDFPPLCLFTSAVQAKI